MRTHKTPYTVRIMPRRRHGEDGIFADLFSELTQIDTKLLETELSRLVELRNGKGITVFEQMRIRVVLAVLRSRQIDRHMEG